MLNIEIVLAKGKEEFEIARELFLEYQDDLGIDLCFQDFEEELKEISLQYDDPEGGIYLLRSQSNFIGCIGLRRFEGSIGEIKRLYIKPEFRKNGMENY